ncbi:MAG: hypothetical protein M1596_06730 [Firmicutes bacterium]|nr:hypothetical protein [Bacillota bacterium]
MGGRRHSLPNGQGSAVPTESAMGPGKASPKIGRVLARLAVETPFDQVSDVVDRTLEIPVDGEMGRQVSENLGPPLVDGVTPQASVPGPLESRRIVGWRDDPMDGD